MPIYIHSFELLKAMAQCNALSQLILDTMYTPYCEEPLIKLCFNNKTFKK